MRKKEGTRYRVVLTLQRGRSARRQKELRCARCETEWQHKLQTKNCVALRWVGVAAYVALVSR